MPNTPTGLARFRWRQDHPPISQEAPEKFREAPLHDADEELRTNVELALELGQLLLVTGEPGCGKTSAAYWDEQRMVTIVRRRSTPPGKRSGEVSGGEFAPSLRPRRRCR